MCLFLFHDDTTNDIKPSPRQSWLIEYDEEPGRSQRGREEPTINLYHPPTKSWLNTKALHPLPPPRNLGGQAGADLSQVKRRSCCWESTFQGAGKNKIIVKDCAWVSLHAYAYVFVNVCVFLQQLNNKCKKMCIRNEENGHHFCRKKNISPPQAERGKNHSYSFSLSYSLSLFVTISFSLSLFSLFLSLFLCIFFFISISLFLSFSLSLSFSLYFSLFFLSF